MERARDEADQECIRLKKKLEAFIDGERTKTRDEPSKLESAFREVEKLKRMKGRRSIIAEKSLNFKEQLRL